MATGKLVSDATKQLNDWLVEGKFKEGDRLPSERAIAKELGIKYYALNRAMGRLIAEGRVERAGYRLSLAAPARASRRWVFHLIVSRRTQHLASYRRAAENLDIELVEHTWEAAEQVITLFQQLDVKGTDGVICDPPFGPSHSFWLQAALQLVRHDIPVVVTGEWGGGQELSAVSGDVTRGVALGVEHLIAGGHRELALVSATYVSAHGIGMNDYWRHLCARGHAGICGERILVQESGLTDRTEVDALVERLTGGDWKLVTGLVVLIGHSCIIPYFFTRLARRGRKVPESLSVVFVGNARTAHAALPRPTMITFDMVLWFELTYGLLLREIRERRQFGGPRQPASIQVAPFLTVRDSTRALHAAVHPPAAGEGAPAFAGGDGERFVPATELSMDDEALARRLRRPYSLAAKASLAEIPRFMPIDLAPYANRPLIFRRGWLGDIPLRCLPPGTHEIHGVPFVVLGGPTRADCGAVVFQSAVNTTGSAQRLPDRLIIPIGAHVEAVYILHGCGYAKPMQPFASYGFHTAGGAAESIPLISLGTTSPGAGPADARLNANIQDWWSDFSHVDFPHAQMAPLVDTDGTTHVSRHVFLYTLEWINPSPKQPLTHIEITVDTSVPTTLGVLAITVVRPGVGV